jgi:hypothetical protein
VTCIVSGFCAEAFVRNKLVVYDDAAFTARSILASPSLYRLGFLADLISFTTGIVRLARRSPSQSCRTPYRSRFFGVLLIIGGFCYLTNSISYFLPPKSLPDLFPWIYLPSLLAEVSLALWLVVAGVNVAKWHAVQTARAAVGA